MTRCSNPLYFKLSIRARRPSTGDGEATDKPQRSQVPDPIEPDRDDESSPRYAGWRAVLFASCAPLGFSVGNLVTLPPMIIHRKFEASASAVLEKLV